MWLSWRSLARASRLRRRRLTACLRLNRLPEAHRLPEDRWLSRATTRELSGVLRFLRRRYMIVGGHQVSWKLTT